MNRIRRQPAKFSKVLINGQTVLPLEVREQLNLKPGDTLRYRMTNHGILLEKAAGADAGPFIMFSEWSSETDEKAYDGL